MARLRTVRRRRLFGRRKEARPLHVVERMHGPGIEAAIYRPSIFCVSTHRKALCMMHGIIEVKEY